MQMIPIQAGDGESAGQDRTEGRGWFDGMTMFGPNHAREKTSPVPVTEFKDIIERGGEEQPPGICFTKEINPAPLSAINRGEVQDLVKKGASPQDRGASLSNHHPDLGLWEGMVECLEGGGEDEGIPDVLGFYEEETHNWAKPHTIT